MVFLQKANQKTKKIYWKERFAYRANRYFGYMNKKNTENTSPVLPTAAQLRKTLESTSKTGAYDRLRLLFDAGTFAELGAYKKRAFSECGTEAKGTEWAGAVCGYGAVNGQPVFAFAQDSTRMKGALDAESIRKICNLYDLALKNGAPVVGIFDGAGVDIFEGVAALAGYGKLMRAVSAASGSIPQIAWVSGNCLGSLAAVCAMFDVVVKEDGAKLYVSSPALTGVKDAQDAMVSYPAANETAAAGYIRHALALLPQNNGEGTVVFEATDDLNRTLSDFDANGDARTLLSLIVDNGDYLELGAAYGEETVTALALIGGVKCGILATDYTKNEGRLSAAGARRAARFVDLCDAFAMPLLTLVNSAGFAMDAADEKAPFAAELAKLATAYANAENAKVTVILGHAIGGAYVLLGSRGIGADVAYALEGAEIGALESAASVAFAENDQINLKTTRKELEDAWRTGLASPVAAASAGEIDDIIAPEELRQRICSALLLLAAKGTVAPPRHNVLPL